MYLKIAFQIIKKTHFLSDFDFPKLKKKVLFPTLNILDDLEIVHQLLTYKEIF